MRSSAQSNQLKYQTFNTLELIIVDDGSRDDSYAVCAGAAAQDNRIRVYQNSRNLGLAKTMNRLVSLSKGTYIAIQEQDDISLPDRLEKEINLLETKPEIGLVSGIAEWLNEDGNAIHKFPGILVRGGQFPQNREDMISYLYVEQSKIVNAACMFRRSILEHVPGPFDEEAKISIDWQFFLHLAHHQLVWGIPEVLVRMNRGTHHPHLTGQKDLQFREARRCIRKIYAEYRNRPDSPINYSLFRQAMSYELTLEGRYYGGLNGVGKIIHALVYNPGNKKAWQTLAESAPRLSGKLFKKLNRG